MTGQTSAPARLFVLLARKAPIGVILRRGPSDWVQMIRWDTKNDVFTPGQWFHGRIYERKCDLSPNGQFIIYDAYKPGNHVTNPSYGERWTAISKPPYFTAQALWLHKQRIGGGGYFLDNKKVFLNHWNDNQTHHPNHLTDEKLEIINSDGNTFMQNSVFYYGLLLDGWRTPGGRKYNRLPLWFKGQPPATTNPRITLRKRGMGTLNLEIFFRYRPISFRGIFRKPKLYEIVPEYKYSLSIYRGEGYLYEKSAYQETELDVTWADFDQRGRLILAKEGKLFHATLNESELVFTELADFNDNKPEAIATPDWARRW